jgi:predicted nucleotidyltransferase
MKCLAIAAKNAEPANPFFILAVKILKTAGAREVYVFGSAAHGAIEAANDIDIAVSGLAPEKFISSFCAIDSILSKSLDLMVKSLVEKPGISSFFN